MITLGYSAHRVEALPFTRRQMEQHDVIALEEPPVEELPAMLAGELDIEEYLQGLDSQFPEYDRRLCTLLRSLHAAGCHIVQVEPYLAGLAAIHDAFAEDETPERVAALPGIGAVYRAEREATRTLIAYYEASGASEFTRIVTAVQDFALADARRLDLRGRLRAAALAELIPLSTRVYAEAGYIHFPLLVHLRRRLGPGEVRPLFLLDRVLRQYGSRGRRLGPGDLLTLYYAFDREPAPERAALLAARSLIFVQLIAKDELRPGKEPYPHVLDMVEALDLVEGLTYGACSTLYHQIRGQPRTAARQTVARYCSRFR